MPGEEDLVDDHLHPWKEPMTTAIRSNDAGPKVPPHGHHAGTTDLRLPIIPLGGDYSSTTAENPSFVIQFGSSPGGEGVETGLTRAVSASRRALPNWHRANSKVLDVCTFPA